MITCLWSQDSYMYSKFGLRLMVGHRHQDILKMFVAYIISFLWVAGKASLVKKKKTKKNKNDLRGQGKEVSLRFLWNLRGYGQGGGTCLSMQET